MKRTRWKKKTYTSLHHFSKLWIYSFFFMYRGLSCSPAKHLEITTWAPLQTPPLSSLMMFTWKELNHQHLNSQFDSYLSLVAGLSWFMLLCCTCLAFLCCSSWSHYGSYLRLPLTSRSPGYTYHHSCFTAWKALSASPACLPATFVFGSSGTQVSHLPSFCSPRLSPTPLKFLLTLPASKPSVQGRL